MLAMAYELDAATQARCEGLMHDINKQTNTIEAYNHLRARKLD